MRQMTMTEKKEWLVRYIPLLREIGELGDEYQRMMELAAKMTLPDDIRLPCSEFILSAAERLTEIAKELSEKTAALRKMRDEIAAAIDSVPQENLRELLYRKYIKGEGMELIAAQMHYDRRWVYRLHDSALNTMCCPEFRAKTRSDMHGGDEV